MMLYPPMSDLIDKVGSRYALINLVAKRAREISAEAEEYGEPLTKKPVSAAIDEVYTGKLTAHMENGYYTEVELPDAPGGDEADEEDDRL